MGLASPRLRRVLAKPQRIFAVALGTVVGIVVGLLLFLDGPPVEQERAQRFASAWSRADYPAMHAELTGAGRRSRPLADFSADYRRAAATATALKFAHGPVGKLQDGAVSMPITVSPRAPSASCARRCGCPSRARTSRRASTGRST